MSKLTRHSEILKVVSGLLTKHPDRDFLGFQPHTTLKDCTGRAWNFFDTKSAVCSYPKKKNTSNCYHTELRMSSRLRTQSVVVHAAKRTTVYPYKKNIKQGWRAGCGAPRYNLMYGILDVFFFLLKHTLAERRMSRKSSFAVVGRCFGSFASCARCSFLRFITSALKKQKKRCD